MSNKQTITLTRQEKKEIKIGELKEEFITSLSNHKKIEEKIRTSLTTLSLNQVLEEKKKIKPIVKKINSARKRLKSLGISFDENGHLKD